MDMIPNRTYIVHFKNGVVIKGIFYEIIYQTSYDSDQKCTVQTAYIILLHPSPHRPERPNELSPYGYDIEYIANYQCKPNG